MTDLDKRFLTNTDETGRFIVKSLTTGKKYYIGPIGNGHPADWGDINPATKKVEGDTVRNTLAVYLRRNH